MGAAARVVHDPQALHDSPPVHAAWLAARRSVHTHLQERAACTVFSIDHVTSQQPYVNMSNWSQSPQTQQGTHYNCSTTSIKIRQILSRNLQLQRLSYVRILPCPLPRLRTVPGTAEPLYGCQGLLNSYALSLSRTTLGYVSFSYLP